MFLVGTLAAVSGLIEGYPLYGGQAVRYLVAAVVWLAVMRVVRLRFVRLSAREWCLLSGLTLLGLVLFNVCVIESVRASGPALVGTVLGTVPLALALAGGRRGRTTPRLLGAAGVVVAGATLATGLGSGNLPGLLWALGALAGEVGFSLLAMPLLARLGAMRVSAYSIMLAVPMLGAIGLVVEGGGMLRPPSLAEAAGLGYLAVVVTVVAFFLWYSSLPRLGPGRAGLFAGLIPVGAIATGAALGTAAPTAYDLIGAGLVVAGIALGLTEGRPREQVRPAAEPVRGPAASERARPTTAA
jgi:drug/metabolite transporter (DMT)-like permease